MSRSSFSSRIMDVLLHQEGENDPEIRALSLATLNDDDRMSLAALLWTHVGWFWAVAVTGWMWIVGFILADLILFVARWRMRRERMLISRYLTSSAQARFVSVNIGLIAIISIDIFVLAMAPSERTAILAIILTVGFGGYVAGLLTAFPVLATLNIVLLAGSLGLGLGIGYSDVARPFALFAPGIAIAFWILMQRTHLTLLGAIRNQRANRLLSLQDPLTKLANRTFMREMLVRELQTIGTEGGPSTVAVLCLDLDGFKGINDRFGHAAGDWVLIHVADILRRHVASGGVACRIGGDEYVLVLPGADEKRVRGLGQSIVAAIGEPFDIGRTISARVGASIGAAIATDRTASMDDLLENADAALYAAKRAGKGRMHLQAASATPFVDALDQVA